MINMMLLLSAEPECLFFGLVLLVSIVQIKIIGRQLNTTTILKINVFFN